MTFLHCVTRPLESNHSHLHESKPTDTLVQPSTNTPFYCNLSFFLRDPQPSTIGTAKMRYFDGCPWMKVSHWHDLWRSNIPNLCLLKQQAGVSGFVAIDAEPWGTSLTDVVEIGIAFIPPFDIASEALQGPPRSLHALQTQYPIQVHKIRVANREQGKRMKRECFTFGPTHVVEPGAVHETLQNLLQSFYEILGPQASLTLIGFDLALEFRVISTTYPGITKYISSWVDLQEIIKDVSHINRSPSMRESLIAFGFEGDNQAVLPNGIAHSAGTDALRIIALLVNLVALSPDATLDIERRPARKWVGNIRMARRQMKANNQFSGRPRPTESYPFRARVRLTGNGGSALTMRQLADPFSKYGPSAIGIHGGKKEGYVCLPSLDELDQFIKHINGSSAGNGQFWEAISEFDPQFTTSRTASEVKESQEVALAAEIEQKKGLRKQKKEEINLEQTCLGFTESVDDIGLGDLWG